MIRKTNFYRESDLKLIGQAFPNVINIIGKPFEFSFNIVHTQPLKIVCSKNVVFQMTKKVEMFRIRPFLKIESFH